MVLWLLVIVCCLNVFKSSLTWAKLTSLWSPKTAWMMIFILCSWSRERKLALPCIPWCRSVWHRVSRVQSLWECSSTASTFHSDEKEPTAAYQSKNNFVRYNSEMLKCCCSSRSTEVEVRIAYKSGWFSWQIVLPFSYRNTWPHEVYIWWPTQVAGHCSHESVQAHVPQVDVQWVFEGAPCLNIATRHGYHGCRWYQQWTFWLIVTYWLVID